MLLIRNFEAKDLKTITSLISDTFNRQYDPGFYLTIYEGWKNGFIVAEDTEGIIGVLAAVISAPMEARILLMAVKPLYRKKGIGTMMLNEFTSRCLSLEMKSIRLEVRVNNEEAIRFYTEKGFNILSILPSYYEDGGAGYLMKKLL